MSWDPACYEVEERVWSGKFAKHYRDPEGFILMEQVAEANQVLALFGQPPLKKWGRRKVQWRRNGATSASWARRSTREIWFGVQAGRAIVIHEVAHILAPSQEGHGPIFRAWYVEAVRRHMGEYHAKRLARGFERRGLPLATVDFPPIPEQPCAA